MLEWKANLTSASDSGLAGRRARESSGKAAVWGEGRYLKGRHGCPAGSRGRSHSSVSLFSSQNLDRTADSRAEWKGERMLVMLRRISFWWRRGFFSVLTKAFGRAGRSIGSVSSKVLSKVPMRTTTAMIQNTKEFLPNLKLFYSNFQKFTETTRRKNLKQKWQIRNLKSK